MTQVQTKLKDARSKEIRVTIGTDPEFFLRDMSSGRLVSAIDYIEGTKDEPTYLKNGAGLQWDNVAMEFSTPPAKDGDDMIDKLRAAFIDVANELPENLEIVALPSAEFESAMLETPEAQLFGCSPDFNAWSGMENIPPDPNMTCLRSCGGHIHIGHVNKTQCRFLLDTFGKANTIKVMDAFHGIISVVLDNSESAVRRRELYGKAGCHRPTKYGIEYRVLSNFWLQTPKLVSLMDSLSIDALNHMKTHSKDVLEGIGDDITIIKEIGGADIQDIINKSNVSDAKLVVDKYLSRYMSENTTDLFIEALDIVAQKTINLRTEWGF